MFHIFIYILISLYKCNGMTLQNKNPLAPTNLNAHLLMFGDGTVDISQSGNPFSNNAIRGLPFLLSKMHFSPAQIREERKNACKFWLDRFGLNCTEVVQSGKGEVNMYQISPRVHERVYMMSTSCPSSGEGFNALDGGFQLFITHPDGFNTGERNYPRNTNLVYSWVRIHIKGNQADCDPHLPNWIVLPYRSKSVAEWTTSTIVFELEITNHTNNPFGEGSSLGMSSPIIDFAHGKITNRLLNYITFKNTTLI